MDNKLGRNDQFTHNVNYFRRRGEREQKPFLRRTVIICGSSALGGFKSKFFVVVARHFINN